MRPTDISCALGPADTSAVHARSGHYRRLITVSAAALAVVLLTTFVLMMRANARDAKVRGQLGQIGRALANYHQDYGCFPPAVTRDALGKPAHSWRVLLLPYLGLNDLYKRYDQGKPWNARENLEFANSASSEVAPWLITNGEGGETNSMVSFVALYGPQTIWGNCSPVEQLAPVNSTMMVVELRNSGISWTEPRDVLVNDVANGILNRYNMTSMNFVTPNGQVGTLYPNTIVFRGSEQDLLRKWTR